MMTRNKSYEEWEPTFEYKKVLFKECGIAGVSIHHKTNDEFWKELEDGTKLALVRDKENKYDTNAVAIALAEDYDGNPENFDFDLILGYIPQTDNIEIAAMLDAGYADKFISEISTLQFCGKLNDLIRISIYIQSQEKELIRPNLLRAISFSFEELKDMVSEMEERGMVYFKIGRDKLQYPIKGENIIVICNDRKFTALYLMRILAAGEKECAPYLENPKAVHDSTGCISILLTNLMGPLIFRKDELDFLETSGSFSANEYLPPSLSAEFESLFESYRTSIV